MRTNYESADLQEYLERQMHKAAARYTFLLAVRQQDNALIDNQDGEPVFIGCTLTEAAESISPHTMTLERVPTTFMTTSDILFAQEWQDVVDKSLGRTE